MEYIGYTINEVYGNTLYITYLLSLLLHRYVIFAT